MTSLTNHGAKSATSVIELPSYFERDGDPSKTSTPQVTRTLSTKSTGTGRSLQDTAGLPPLANSTEEVPEWNHPRINAYRTAACFWGFIVLGMNDAAYGALIPYLETYYHLNYTIISLAFLAPFVGYTTAALINATIHEKFGQRGIAFLSPAFKLIAYIIIAVHPPYAAVVIAFLIAGFGNGLQDSAWNAWIGPMKNSNQILGLMHGCYGLGATLSPVIATTMVTKGHLQWYTFYYIMLGVAGLEFATTLTAFWGANAAEYRAKTPRSADNQNRMKEALLKQPAARITWLCALFLLGYVGAEVALGGWIVTFMIRVRNGSAFASGMTETGFWLGITVGRVILGFVTPRIGEKLAIAAYLVLAMVLELLFWLVPQFYVSAVAVSLQGFFLGPLFPAAVVVATKLLPRHLHVSAIGFAAAFGGGGAAVFPFVVGAIAQVRGVKVLQPIILSLFAVILVLWLALPKLSRKKD